MDTTTQSIAVLVGELLGLALVALVINVSVGRILRLLAGADGGERREALVGSIRRAGRRFVLITFVLAGVAVAGVDVWLILRGEDVLAVSREQVAHITPEMWIAIGIRAGQVFGILLGTMLGLKLVRAAVARAEVGALGWKHLQSNDDAIRRFFASLLRVTEQAAWLGVLVLAAQLLGLPDRVALFLYVGLRVYVILSAGIIFWRSMDVVIETIEALSRQLSEKKGLLDYYEKLEHLIPIARRALEYVIYVTVATLAVQQIEMVADLADWGPRLARIIGIVFISRVVVSVLHLVTEELMVARASQEPKARARRMTMVPLVRSTEKYVVYFFAVVFVLEEVGIDPMPVLAGAGILGVAIGFGAQALVRDVVTGLFILFENYFLVGDFIRVGEIQGTVEGIDLRTTQIRDMHGALHIVPNGDVQHVVHQSKDYSIAVVDVGVAYESDIDHVERVLRRVGEEIAAESADVLEASRVLGLQSFGESEMVIRTSTRVTPANHLNVARDLRKRIKNAFDAEAIEIPYAKRVVMMAKPD